MSVPQGQGNDILAATLWMGGTIIAFSAMAIGVRELSGAFDPFQILFFRSLFGVVILSGIAVFFTGTTLRPVAWRLQLARHVIHFVAQVGWVMAITLLPLAQVFAIEFTSPIWATIIAILFLGERATAGRMMAIGAGFVGVLVILRPGVLPLELGALVMLATALGFGLVNAMTKRLTRTVTPFNILFWMCLVQACLGLAPTLARWVTPELAHLPWLLLVGSAGLAAHYCLSSALSRADAVIVLPMEFLRLPLIALAGFMIYGEGLDVPTLAGGALIALGIWANLRRERRSPAAAPAAMPAQTK